jgi:hypothetical protein
MIPIGSKGAKMAELKKSSKYKDVVKKLKTAPIVAKPKGPTAEEVRQQISNLCVLIGDKQYGIRENAKTIAKYENEIDGHYNEIDGLRAKLTELEQKGARPQGA